MQAKLDHSLRSVACGLLLVAIAGPSAAQTIQNVSGQLVHGNAVTIQGQNFGTRPNPSNIIFDTMESGSFDPRWTDSSGMSIVNQSRHANSQRAAYHNFRNWNNHGYFTGGSNNAGPWFCQYWFKLGTNFDWGVSPGVPEGQAGANLNNVKFFRMWESGSTDENFSMAAHSFSSPGGVCVIANEYIGGNVTMAGYAEGNFVQNWTKGVWHCFQFEFKDSTQRGNDGVIRWWVDGELAFEATDMMTREDSAAYKRPYILGFFNSVSDAFADDNDFWIDDPYIDTSWARVELGNASSYNACTHREIQKPTAWATGEITVSFNAGSFAAGSTAYLFVVDPNGNVSPGRQVTLGGGTDPGAPGQPGKPTL